MIEDRLLHLLIHIAFVCSLRAGEAAGISLEGIDLTEGSLWIKQEVQRITDEALSLMPDGEIIREFPKKSSSSKSLLVLKNPKTKGSIRKIYLPAPLVDEIQVRMLKIKKEKDFYGDTYNDYDLLFCLENGDPIEPRRLEKKFLKWQKDNDIPYRIDLQGLRKSGQTHKVHITGNDYQVVSKAGGQSTAVLFSNYLAVDDSELKNLAALIEDDFYGDPDAKGLSYKDKTYIQSIIERCQTDSELTKLLLNRLQSAHNMQPGADIAHNIRIFIFCKFFARYECYFISIHGKCIMYMDKLFCKIKKERFHELISKAS